MANTLSGRKFSCDSCSLLPAAGCTKKHLDAEGLYRTRSLASKRAKNIFSPKRYLYFVPRFTGQIAKSHFSLKEALVQRRVPCSTTYQEWWADPREVGQRIEIGRFFQHSQLILSHLQHFFWKGWLPGIQLQHLNATQNLIHQLNTGVFIPHLLHLDC